MKSRCLLFSWLLSARTTTATNFVYVSSYTGTVSSLDLSLSRTSSQDIQLARTVGAAISYEENPGWLMLDEANNVLYSINEGLSTPQASLTSFRTNPGGSFTVLGKFVIPSGPVSGVIFGKNRDGLALAHYAGSAVTTWNISDPSSLQLLENMDFTLDRPGTVLDRQSAPHPHQVVLDPTGKFLFVPDLGADLIRVFSIDEDSLALTELEATRVEGGSGPRHMAFVAKGQKTYAYLVNELSNTIIGYEVVYGSSSVSLKEIFTIPTHGDGEAVPAGAAASEIVISPDGNYAIVSSRAENSFVLANFDPSNSTTIESDPLINFLIDEETGRLEVLQIVPAGGRFPRHFSINRAGDLLAVGLQFDGRVTLVERDVGTGKLGRFVSYSNIEGQVTAAIFHEQSSE